MRVPKSDGLSTRSKIKHLKIDQPILIPRLPVITTDKQRIKVTKQIESYARQSMEYRDLIKYLRTNVDMDECTFLSNFKAGSKKGMIEIHHAPYNLYTITDIIMRKHEAIYGYIDELLVAEEVMRIHYKGLIGLVPLSITCHQLVHDGRLTVPLWCVYGRFVEFTKLYYDWIPDPVLEALQEQIELSRKFKVDPIALKDVNSILDVQYVYLDVEGETPMEQGLYDKSVLKTRA